MTPDLSTSTATKVAASIELPTTENKNTEGVVIESSKMVSTTSVSEEALNQARKTVTNSKDTVIGMGLMASASFFTSWMTVCVNIAATMGLCSAGSTFWRGILQTIVAISQTVIGKHNILGPKEKRIWLFLRGFIGGCANLCFFYAVAHMPIGDANTLVFTSPVFTALFAICLVGEKWHWIDALCTLLTFVGVLCVTKPTFIFGSISENTEDYTIPSIIALISSVLMALTYAIVKKIGKEVPTSIVLEYFAVLSIVVALIQTWITSESVIPQTDDPLIWAYIAGIMVLGYLAQVALNRGLQIGAAGPVSAVRFLDIFFSYIWQITVMKKEANWLSLVGAGIMCICIILMAYKKYLILKQDKQKLNYLEAHIKQSSSPVPKIETKIQEQKEDQGISLAITVDNKETIPVGNEDIHQETKEVIHGNENISIKNSSSMSPV
ncbi:hypothetical protein WA158_006361 [Blastocystis sp. Blastoise]